MKRVVGLAIILSFTILFYLQDRYAIPNIDDWAYSFIVDEHSDGYLSVIDDDAIRVPVRSFSDGIVSQSRDYFKSNGRFIVHTLIQFFCGCWEMKHFVILNTVVFAIFMLLLLKTIRDKLDVWETLLVLSSIWLLIPYIGFTFLGPVSLCVNYLWSCTATLLFLLLLDKVLCLSTPLLSVFVVFSFLTGSLQESFSIGVSAALFLYMLYKRRTLDRHWILAAVSYMAGMLVCVLSPSNFGRAESIGGFGFHFNAITGLLSSPLFILFLALNVVLVVRKKIRNFIQDNFIIYVSTIVNIAFVLFVAFTARHQLTAINVFSFILLFRFLFDVRVIREKRKALSIVTVFMTLLLFSTVFHVRKEYHDAYHTLVDRALASDDGVVDGKEYESMTTKYVYNRFYNNYITCASFVGWNLAKELLSLYLSEGKNDSLIKAVLPESVEHIVSGCTEENEVLPGLYRLYNGCYVYKEANLMPLDNVIIKGEIRSNFISNSLMGTTVNASEVFCYNSQYYYLFSNLPAITAVDSLMVSGL